MSRNINFTIVISCILFHLPQGKKNGNNSGWQFWQQHNKPLEIKDQEMFNKTLEYIYLNPVMAGFVNKTEDWKYSSAKDFNGMRGLIDLSYTS